MSTMTINETDQVPDERDGSDEERRRSRFVLLSEAGMVAACVLVFFGFLTMLIKAIFPYGTSLIIEPDADDGITAVAGGEVELGINAGYGTVDDLFAGEILKIQRRVQHRSSNALTWNDASVGDKVVRKDAVQTFARSTAVVEVNRSSQLTMGENSLIVFDQQEADPFLSDQNSVLLMVDGELSGKLSGADKSRFRFGVNLPNSDVALQPRRAGDDVEFLISVNDDQSTTVNIHEGTAQIVGSDGKLKTIGDQQSITIDPTGSKVSVTDLSHAPKVTGPAHDTAVTYRNVPEKIQFAWNAVADADRYHIVIARDPGFSDRVVDDDVIGTSFTHGALGPGTYYWHVRSRVGWSQSERSAVRRLQVRQDLDPPMLEVDPPPESIQAGTWRLHGRTDSDATVFIDETPVEHIGGQIDHPVELNPGANVIVVKAVDEVGNLSYAPLLVNAK
ncbi:MAG: hypothetical protein ACE5FV_12300 [Woeseia sp.]